jgi:hypothetical protein
MSKIEMIIWKEKMMNLICKKLCGIGQWFLWFYRKIRLLWGKMSVNDDPNGSGWHPF